MESIMPYWGRVSMASLPVSSVYVHVHPEAKSVNLYACKKYVILSVIRSPVYSRNCQTLGVSPAELEVYP